MKQYFKTSFRAARRVSYVISAVLISATTLPLLFNAGSASALQLQSRSMTMSDSSASGGSITSGVGSGTNVSYNVAFTTSSAGTASSMVIDFCQESPIINDTCSTPTGFSASGATLNATATAGTVQTSTDNWSVTASAGQVKLADDNVSGSNPSHDIQPSTAESFTLSGITNPDAANCSGDANCTFYARIYTYAKNTYAPVTGTGYTNSSSVGSFVDYGGVALSTTNPITISATVQEQLTFCVSSTDAATWSASSGTITASSTVDGCSLTNLAYPALTLGHGSPTLILDTTQVNTGTIYTDLSTNATHGAVIDMRNSNLTCTGPGGAGGLSADNGTTCAIPPMNNSGGTPASITAGTADFGMTCAPYTVTGAGTTGTVNCNSDYYTAGHGPGTSYPTTYYGMDTTNGTDGSVVGPYGSEIALSTGPTYNAYDDYVFGATASLTTPAGIYAADLSLIATGTF